MSAKACTYTFAEKENSNVIMNNNNIEDKGNESFSEDEERKSVAPVQAVPASDAEERKIRVTMAQKAVQKKKVSRRRLCVFAFLAFLMILGGLVLILSFTKVLFGGKKAQVTPREAPTQTPAQKSEPTAAQASVQTPAITDAPDGIVVKTEE